MKSRVEEATNPSKSTRMFKKFGHGIVLTPRNLSAAPKEDEVNHYNLSTGVVTTHPSTYHAASSLKTTPPIIPDTLKPDTPSKLRQLLPILLCVISFATVMSILIVYIDTTEIRHQQFRLNMTRDYDLLGVQQDNPSLIAYIREVHMKKYPNMVTNFLATSGPAEHLNFTNSHELTPKLASDIASLVGNKQKGVFFQSLTGSSGPMMTAPWLAETLGWTGYIVEPDPRKYFALRKDNARRNGVQVIHACLSPTGYPKEVTLHHEDLNDVKITSVTDEEDWFHSRVKCFPLYTLLLAVNHTQIDVLSLGCQGQELEILQTIPWNKVQINVISLHLSHNFDHFEMETAFYTKRLINFMRSRFYKLATQVSHNLIFTKIGSARNL
ncbi:protein Star-like [Culicoides brevitarsis]|uniref:protein Star n=1 Tax=Culicoides brevitarsis TaxID=469753 RepID=UPI00307C7315